MPLLGLITQGTVERIFHSISFAKADVLVLFARENQFGHVLFEKGQVITAGLEHLSDENALTALKQWTNGHYSLMKRHNVGVHTRAQVLLHALNPKVQRVMSRWLKKNKYQVNFVGYSQQALPIIEYVEPDIIVTSCPKQSLGMTCAEFIIQLRQKNVVTPLIIAVEDGPEPCTELAPPCLRIPATVADLEKVLSSHQSKTHFGPRAVEIEETAKVNSPKGPYKSPSNLHRPVTGLVPKVGGASEKLSRKDYFRALLVFLLGSGMVWLTWWLVRRALL